MIDNQINDDIYFKELMSKSKLELPFSDFEDNVMLQIENKIQHQKALPREIKISWFFFIAGSVFGIILSFFLSQLHEPVFGFNPANLTLLFQIVFASVLLTQIDTLIKFSRRFNSIDKKLR